MSWGAVHGWLTSIAGSSLPEMDLSPPGALAARDAALAALSPEVLGRVASLGGTPFQSARFVAARTVFTAPLEWLAVLLGRGTTVELQLPSAPSDTGRAWQHWAQLARDHGLPLRLVPKGEGTTPELLVAMGSDDTIAELGQRAAASRFLGFGARYSAAVFDSVEDVPAIVFDLALYDGRGCMSPGLVVVPDPETLGPIAEAFAQALADTEVRWPRGRLSDAEHASIRSRGALARVLGRCDTGPAWAVHQLPWSHRSVASLPRAPLLCVPPDPSAAIAALAVDPHLSSLGTRRAVRAAGGGRVVLPGTQQSPPVERLHDGVDWLRATFRDGGVRAPTPDAKLQPGEVPDTEAT